MAHAFSTDGSGRPAHSATPIAASSNATRRHITSSRAHAGAIGSRCYHARRLPMARIVPDVAVVTFNADYYLLRLITTLAPLSAAGEIGAVHVWDNASTDRTADLLAILAETHPWLRVHRAARNIHHGPALDALLRGHGESEWVLLLDADTEVVRPFSLALDVLDLERAAFVGQIQPYESQLYAYLAHLLVHRPRYLTLPRFRDHGAPGVEYFRGVDARGERFVRFRWCDFVHHFGQGSLRRVVERGDRANKFYEFARREAAAHPKSDDRIARERELQERLDCMLEAQGAMQGASTQCPVSAGPAGGPTRDRQHSVPNRAAAPDCSRRRPAAGPRRRFRESLASAYVTVKAPRTASWLRAARRLALVQQPREAMELVSLLAPNRPSCVLEIGTAYGGSLLLWARIASADALIVSVDLPQWELDDPADDAVCRRIHGVGSPGQRVRLVRGNSHDSRTHDRTSQLLEGRLVDFLFIDGDHTYAGVAQDFADYVRFVKPGGIVALHDIHPHPRGWGGDVPRFWRE